MFFLFFSFIFCFSMSRLHVLSLLLFLGFKEFLRGKRGYHIRELISANVQALAERAQMPMTPRKLVKSKSLGSV